MNGVCCRWIEGNGFCNGKTSSGPWYVLIPNWLKVIFQKCVAIGSWYMVVAVHVYFIEEKIISGSGSLQEKRKENGGKSCRLYSEHQSLHHSGVVVTVELRKLPDRASILTERTSLPSSHLQGRPPNFALKPEHQWTYLLRAHQSKDKEGWHPTLPLFLYLALLSESTRTWTKIGVLCAQIHFLCHIVKPVQ